MRGEVKWFGWFWNVHHGTACLLYRVRYSMPVAKKCYFMNFKSNLDYKWTFQWQKLRSKSSSSTNQHLSKVDPSWRTLCIKEPERTGSLPPEPGELMLLIEFSTDFSDVLFDLSSDLSSDKAWGIQGQVTTIRGLTSQVPHHQRQHTSLPHTSPQDPDWKSLAENILNNVVTRSNPSVKEEIHLNICKLPLLHWIFAPKYQITFYTPNL